MTSPVYWFDEAKADHVCWWIETYIVNVMGEWAGKPFVLEPWQRKIVREVFGWKRKNDKGEWVRRYRVVYIEIPRKNGKSNFCAALGLYLALADGEPGAHVYAAAKNMDQAKMVWDPAKLMVLKGPKLKKHCRVYRNSLAKLEGGAMTGGFFQPLTADADTQHGKNIHAAIVDELHVQADRELWDVLCSSTGSRREPLVIGITTAGHDRSSLCWELHEKVGRVAKGEITGPDAECFYGVIYAADPEDDPQAESTWYKANPSLGSTKKIEYMREQASKAINEVGSLNSYLRLELNVWTQQETKWISHQLWDANKGAVDPVALKGRRCVPGVDLSSNNDTTALSLVFPREDGGIIILPHFFLPANNIEKLEKEHKLNYRAWADKGFLTLTQGNGGNIVDEEAVRAKINELAEVYEIDEVAFDPFGAGSLIAKIELDGFTPVVIKQTMPWMSDPTKEFERLLKSNKVNHGNHPILTNHVANAMLEYDSEGLYKPTKKYKRSPKKIDGLIATLVALKRVMVTRDRPGSGATAQAVKKTFGSIFF